MSTSRHPIAYRLEGLIGGQAKLLATVMALPLVDGIFAALIVAGALDTPLRIVETGLLIFGGSATMAVILAEMDGTRRDHVESILVLGGILVPIAALEAAFAPTIESVLDLVVFERFAALVILAIAAKTASSQVGDVLPSPGTIIGLGLLASLQPSSLSLVIRPDVALMGRAAASAGVGVAFALGVALAGPRLRGRVNLDRFRFGSSVALGMLAVTVLEFPGVPTDQPIALYVLLVTAVLSYEASGVVGAAGEDSSGGDTGVAGADDSASDATDSGVAADSDPTGTPDPNVSPPDGVTVDRPQPQAGGAATVGFAGESDAPGHGIDPVDTAQDAADERRLDSSDQQAVTDGERDAAEDRSETDTVDADEAREESGDSDSQQAEGTASRSDDAEEPRQADEEYGQSRAPWL